MNELFRILAIRVLPGCKPYIRKVLKENKTYFLYNEYEDDPISGGIRLNEDYQEPQVPENFFESNLPKGHSLRISLSAIVGKNGDGKSSLIELAMRILSNFSYASGYLQDHEGLVPVTGVNAILYYGIGKKIYSIESLNDEIIFNPNGDIKLRFSIKEPENNIERLKPYKHQLFYTHVSNYSLYAYNSKELKQECESGNCWINGIFHKNDGYQTPIVLNPWRNEGNIDINKENYLTTQRLMSLFVDDEKDNSIRHISDTQYAKYFVFDIEPESKLYEVTIRQYFRKVAARRITDIIYETKNNYRFENSERFKIPFWSKVKWLMDEHKPLLDYSLKVLEAFNEDSEEENTDISSESRATDLEIYTNSFLTTDRLRSQLLVIKSFKESGYVKFNYLQLQRIILIANIFSLWKNKYKEFFPKKIEDSDNITNHAVLYILYKTISIFTKYTAQYDDVINELDGSSMWLFSEKRHIDINKLIKQIFDKLIDDVEQKKSHVTLKLRQTFNFLKYNQQYRYIDFVNDKKEELIASLHIGDTYKYIIDFTDYWQRLVKIQNKNPRLSTIELLPPPIFDVEIVLKQEDGARFLSLLSSGERQRLNSVSSVIYHLRNIDSIAKGENMIKYRYVNLIFEEVELYFHPEYQQKYIQYLLEQITKANLEHITGINICFVTHSPFILSDIPKNNVLFLKEGKIVRPMQEDTFGSNIHTLLQNGFFLQNVSMGNFAKSKINKLFADLHNGRFSPKMYEDILLVSEPFIKGQLLKLYNQYSPSYYPQQEIERLRKEFEELKDKKL